MEATIMDNTNARRTFADKLLEAWSFSRETVWLGALVVLVLQLLLTAFADGSPFFPSWWLWLAVTGAQFLALLARRRAPLPAFLVHVGVVLLGATLVGAGTYSWLPLLCALGSVVLRARLRSVAAAVVFAFAAAIAVALELEGANGTWMSSLIPVLFTVVVAVAIAGVARGRLESLHEQDRRLAAEEGQRIAAEKQRRAELISRVATDLHDSVGHNLTGIITLTEGIAGHTREEDAEGVIELINELAREALGETRSAVRAITPAGLEELVGRGPQGYRVGCHTWQDIAELLDNVRSTGLIITVTEHGARTEDEGAQELAYTVLRESLTNVMRHATSAGVGTGSGAEAPAPAATAVVVSFTFQPGSLQLTITDNGGPGMEATQQGMGLAGLSARVTRAGGEFRAGPIPTGWQVAATIPARAEAGRSAEK